jgi:NAD(P)H-nitrite reductase large subunit
VNALGGDLRYTASPPPTRLKVIGIDLLAVGTTTAHGEGGREIRAADDHPREYRKLVLQDGQLVGAIMIGHPELFDQVTDAVAARRAVAEHRTALRAGDWSML